MKKYVSIKDLYEDKQWDNIADAEFIDGSELSDYNFGIEFDNLHFLLVMNYYIYGDLALAVQEHGYYPSDMASDEKKDVKNMPGFKLMQNVLKEIDIKLNKASNYGKYSSSDIFTENDLLVFWSDICKDEDENGNVRLNASKLLAEHYNMFKDRDVEEDEVEINNPHKDFLENGELPKEEETEEDLPDNVVVLNETSKP